MSILLCRTGDYELVTSESDKYTLQSVIKARVSYSLSYKTAALYLSYPPCSDSLEASRIAGIPVEVRNTVKSLVRIGALDVVRNYDSTMLEAYSISRAMPQEVIDLVVAKVSLQPGQSALDIGTGIGCMALGLRDVVEDVTAVDISNDCVTLARSRAGRRGYSMSFSQIDPHSPFDTAQAVDLITISQSMHWLTDTQLSSNLLSLLKPGGYLVCVETKALINPLNLLYAGFGYGMATSEQVSRELSLQLSEHSASVAKYAGGLGFEMEESITYIEHKTFDRVFARALLFDYDVTQVFEQASKPWDALDQVMGKHTIDILAGELHWQILPFRRTS